MEISFAIDDQLLPALTRAVRAAADFSPALEKIAARMEADVRQRFDGGKGPTGAAWLPSQRVRDKGGKTLIDTRRLLDSITRDHDATTAVVGTNTLYAAIHQLGGTIRPRNRRALKTPFGPRGAVNMPARPFLGFGDEDSREIHQILGDHLRAAFEGGVE